MTELNSHMAFEGWQDGRNTPMQIGILLMPSFSNFGLAAFIEPLAISNWLTQQQLFNWELVSLDGQPVKASNGLMSCAEQSIATSQDYDLCVVIASFDVHRHTHNPQLRSWLRRQACFGAAMVGIETGTELLAAAGVLDGHAAAVHWDNLQGFQESYPRIQTSAQLYTVERQRMTCAGATSVLDMLLTWLQGQVQGNLAKEVAMHMLVSEVREAEGSQMEGHKRNLGALARKMYKAIELMEQHIEETLTCEEIAGRVGLSRRQMERQFMQYTGLSPLKYYLSLRLSRAHSLLQQTRLSVSQVAAGSGFCSLEHFSRVYRAKFGCAPSSDRSQSWGAPVMRQPLMPDADKSQYL
jgi:AraC family carnitine catabolism transcriptional activator